MTDVAVVSVAITGDPKALDASLRKIEASLRDLERKGRGAGAGVAKGVDGAAPAMNRASTGTLAFARALAALQREGGNTAGAIRTLQGALAGQDRAGVAYLSTQRQIIKLQRELETSLAGSAGGVRSFQASIGGLGAAMTGLGALFAGSQIIQFGMEAGRAAISLERTQAVLRAVSGSTDAFNNASSIAAANQRLFGGSIESNLSTLQQFTFIANRTGASIEELNRVAQLLAAVNPAEGIAGAGFSLSELASGDITSIVERFNLSRTALNELKNEAGGDTAALLQGVTDLLAEQGVTSETLAASLTTNAQTYNALGAAAEQAAINVGAFLAAAAQPIAQGLTAVLDDFNRIAGAGDQVATFQASLVAGSATFAEYTAGAAGINAQLAGIGQSLPPLSAAQYAYAQALILSGQSEAAAVAASQAHVAELAKIAQFTAAATNEQNNYYAILSDLPGVIDGIIAADASQIAGISELISQRNMGTISAEDFRAAILEMATATFEAAAADEELAATGTIVASVLNLEEDAAKRVDAALRDAANAAGEAANAGGTLEDQARAAADALLAAGNAGAAAAGQLAASSAGVDVATAAYVRLANAQAAVRASGREGGLVGGGSTAGLSTVQKERAAATAATRAIKALNVVRSGGGGGGGGGRKPGGGGGKSEADKAAEQAVKTAEKEAAALTKIANEYQDRTLQAERTFQTALTNIQEEFSKRRADAGRDYSDQQFEDRVGFYRALAGLESNAVRMQASAEYESLAQEANQIRDTQGADVAAAFLAAAGQIAAARARRAEELEQAKKDGDASLAYLEGLDRMEREVEDRKLARLREGEGSINDQEATKLADAEASRQQAIGDASTRAGDALATAQGTATEATRLTNDALTDQLTLLSRIGARPTGAALPAGTMAADEATATTAAGGGNAPDLAALTSRLDAIRKATEDVRRAIEAAARRGPFGGGD